ncbi:MAG: BsuPI-related putative proteinase inhibitor [bacterium]
MKRLFLALGLICIVTALATARGYDSGTFPLANRLHPKVVRLQSTVVTDQPVYTQGQPVEITYEVTNPKEEPVTLNFNTSREFDAVIRNAIGIKVWQFSADRGYIMVLGTLELEPKETKRFQVQWNQTDDHNVTVPPGFYTIRAFLTSTNSFGHIATAQIRIMPAADADAYILHYQNSGCTGEPVRSPGENEEFTADYQEDHLLYLFHSNASYNCCIEEIAVTMNTIDMADMIIRIYEDEKLQGDGCRCICDYDLTIAIAGLFPGIYTVRFYDKKAGRLRGEIPRVVIPWEPLHGR